MTYATMTTASDAPRSSTARIAGFLYLLITAAAVIAHFYVPAQLIVPGDMAATVTNIKSSESLLRLSIGSEFVVLLSEVVLTVLLYSLFRTVNRTIALTAVAARLVMTVIHGANLLNYYFVLILLGDGSFAATFTSEQVNALVGLFLEAHSFGFSIGIAFLIIHVFALGYLIIKSGYVPKVLGILFVIAGFGYLYDSIALLLLASYDTTPGFIAAPIAIAEIAFPIWLLVKGISVPKDRAQPTVQPQQAQGVGL